MTDPLHEQRLRLLNEAKSVLSSVPGIITTVNGDLEDAVGQLDTAIERLIRANNHVTEVAGESTAGGAIFSANVSIDNLIDTIHEAVARCGDAQIVTHAAEVALDRMIARIQAAPNN